MAAHDPASITNGAGKMVYTRRGDNLPQTVTTNQKMNFNLAARGSGEVYTGAAASSQTITNPQDGPVGLVADPGLSSFTVAANATASLNAGSIWFFENGFTRVEWRVRSVTIDNITTPTSLTSMTLERVDNPMTTMVLTSETMSQP